MHLQPVYQDPILSQAASVCPLSQVGLKACQTRGRHSLNEWDYALPARPTGSCPILRAAGDVEGKTVLNIKKGDILGMQVMA